MSRLSAVSGVSRSPSPHKMLLETSFCGPKPLNSNITSGAINETINTDELEQIILARKHDVTKPVLPEGLNIDLSTPKKLRSEIKREANGNIKEITEKIVKRTQIVTDKNIGAASRGNAIAKKGGVLKKNNRTVVGVTPSGTTYIRIKLKADDQYDDKGVSINEHIVEESEVAKPDSLSLKTSTTKKVENHLTPTTSPKPSRNTILRSTDSRSPSPATGLSVSRKSSFCSLFRSKEAVSDNSRDRSRSKSRESDKSGGVSANSTPSKQRSVLAIFKSRKNSSKSSSPIDPELLLASNEQGSRTPTSEIQQRPGSTTPKLRYYDAPIDGKSAIHIPLHTPPEEKEFKFTSATTTTTTTQSITKPISNVHITNADITDAIAKLKSPKTQPKIQTKEIEKEIVVKVTTEKAEAKMPESTKKLESIKPIVNKLAPSTNSSQQKSNKDYRIVLPDGSIRIPLRHSSDEQNEVEEEVESNSQQWSTAAQHNSSQESQDTVISSKASLVSGETNANKQQNVVPQKITAQVPVTTAVEKKLEAPPKQKSNEETTTVTIENGGIRAMTKERKRILFQTKIGSGSEEQIFATQLSLSKTESLSSQLSEQGPNLESPIIEKTEPSEKQTSMAQQQLQQIHEQKSQQEPIVVKMRSKEDKIVKESETAREGKIGKQEVINVNRHSMYIENIEEIMETQKRLEAKRKNSMAREQPIIESAVVHEKPKRSNKSQTSSRSRDSTEDQRVAGSSGSEHESEVGAKVIFLTFLSFYFRHSNIYSIILKLIHKIASNSSSSWCC